MKIWSNGWIMGALSCLKTPSANIKTGDMVQLSILPVREKTTDSIKHKTDYRQCGDCPLKSSLGGPCYVNTVSYNSTQIKNASAPVEDVPKMDKPLRLGAYGDPAFIPIEKLEELTASAPSYTGYTHQWHNVDAEYARYNMASIDHISEARGITRERAKDLGYRTFRILKEKEELDAGEIMCPNYTHGVQCAKCGLCAGTSRGSKDIAIRGHGAPNKLAVFRS